MVFPNSNVICFILLQNFNFLFNSNQIHLCKTFLEEIIHIFHCYLITDTIYDLNLIDKLTNNSKIIIIDKVSLTTIEKFSDNFKLKRTTKQEEIDEVWILILPSFSSFFINKSYIKLDQMKLQGPTTLKIDMSKNKYIKLQNFGHGSSSYVSLIYHIELEQLFAIKTFVSSESEKLFSRENKNYKLLRHPSIPLSYRETEFNGHNKRIIMEYIRGSNLLNINSLSFEIEDKINIIFQMMLLIEFQNLFIEI